MGRRLPFGARAQLTLRLRLLAAAAGIVAVSLLLAGGLTWVLVRDLELQTAQDQLDRQVAAAALAVRFEECVVPRSGTGLCRTATPSDFVDRLDNAAPRLGGERLLLLDAQRAVLYDSGGASTIGVPIPLAASKRFPAVFEARTTLDGQAFLVAAVRLPGARVDPLGAQYVLVAEPQSLIASTAAGDLAARLLLAGGAALILAVLLILLVSRSLARPLAQLAEAAEDIAAGNYSRRVAIGGTDEIGLLGAAFNRMAEAVERARKVQRDFLANVSHELKTPLTSLIGFSQALVDGSLRSESERTHAATIIHEESERVLRMAQELLDLARVESGSISMHLAEIDLSAELQQELEIVRPRATARGLTLTLDAADRLPPVVADAERLHQVIDNLLDNAVKYAPEGASVRVAALAGGRGVEVTFSNPAGAHPPDPARMFDRFYRADPSRSAAAGGVGLGLAISRELAVAMGGRLWADLDSGGELAVHLALPRSPSPPPAAPAEQAAAAATAVP